MQRLAAAGADSIDCPFCALALQSGGREAERAAANNPARLVRYDSAPPDMGWQQSNYGGMAEQRGRGLSDVDQRSAPGMAGGAASQQQQQQREREQQQQREREQREREQREREQQQQREREQQQREQREREQQQQREREQQQQREREQRERQQQQQKAAQQQPGMLSARPGGGRGMAPSGWSGDDELDTMQNEMRSLGLGAADHMAAPGSAGTRSLLSSLHEEQSAAEVERARQQVRPLPTEP